MRELEEQPTAQDDDVSPVQTEGAIELSIDELSLPVSLNDSKYERILLL